MPIFASPAAQLLGRLLLAIIFIMGGLGKISAMDGTIAYIAKSGMPFPSIAYGASVLIELGGGLAILAGLFTRPVAFVMAVFCVVTGVMFHLAVGDGPNMINFYKNLAMAGGFLQLAAVGAGAWSVDGWLASRSIKTR